MKVFSPEGAAPTSRSEQAFLDVLSQPNLHGVVYANWHAWSGRRKREVDAFVITPRGCYVVEVKGVSGSGLVEVPVDWAWSIDGRNDSFKNGGSRTNPGVQADEATKLVAGMMKRHSVDLGFVMGVVAIDGEDLTLADADESRFVYNGLVHVGRVVDFDVPAPFLHTREISAETAIKALRACGVPAEETGSVRDMLALGFRRQSAIDDEALTEWLTRPVWSRMAARFRTGDKVMVAQRVLLTILTIIGVYGMTLQGHGVDPVLAAYNTFQVRLDLLTPVANFAVLVTLLWKGRTRIWPSLVRSFYLGWIALTAWDNFGPMRVETRVSALTTLYWVPWIFGIVFVVSFGVSVGIPPAREWVAARAARRAESEAIGQSPDQPAVPAPGDAATAS